MYVKPCREQSLIYFLNAVPILITEKHYLFAMMREKPEELAVIVEYK
jgi:hypothetical protein